MLYLGHFSFDEDGTDRQPRHGYFSVVAEAESPESALSRFKATIQKMREENEIFRNVIAVYIDDIVEIESMPDEPFVTLFQSSEGEFPKSVSHSLPGMESPKIRTYGFSIDLDQFEIKPRHDYKEKTPYLEFGRS